MVMALRKGRRPFFADATAAPEQRALLAQSTVDNTGWASKRLDEVAAGQAAGGVDVA